MKKISVLPPVKCSESETIFKGKNEVEKEFRAWFGRFPANLSPLSITLWRFSRSFAKKSKKRIASFRDCSHSQMYQTECHSPMIFMTIDVRSYDLSLTNKTIELSDFEWRSLSSESWECSHDSRRRFFNFSQKCSLFYSPKIKKLTWDYILWDRKGTQWVLSCSHADELLLTNTMIILSNFEWRLLSYRMKWVLSWVREMRHQFLFHFFPALFRIKDRSLSNDQELSDLISNHFKLFFTPFSPEFRSLMQAR